MPLIESKSKEAFKKNVAEMVHSGHPVDQSVAAAYSVKRKAGGHDEGSSESEREAHERNKYGK